MDIARITTLIVAMAFLLPALPVQAAMAHGVDVIVTPREAVEVVASFDGGDPMSGAQVTVFAPEDPAEPWLQGTADEEGRFYFVPDPARPGTWEVRVRQAGHGEIIRLEVDDSGIAGTSGTGLTALQKVLMAAAVGWGAIGTALYFKRRAA